MSTATGTATCNLRLMQAGSISLPYSLVLLPLFDLGLRDDIINATPAHFDPSQFNPSPKNPVDILNSAADTTDVKPSNIRAVIFSHLHFDHSGEMGRGLPNAELWLGHTFCTWVWPGYPDDPKSVHWKGDLPSDGSRKIVEWTIPESELGRTGDRRAGKVEKAISEGRYVAVERRLPLGSWRPVGPFERDCDLFGDGSAVLVDAPGHVGGHSLLYVRVQAPSGGNGEGDYVFLTGDAFHHADLLKQPRLMAKPSFSWKGRTMHEEDPERALDVIEKIKELGEAENVRVVGIHDRSIAEAITGRKDDIDRVICVNEWKSLGWKRH